MSQSSTTQANHPATTYASPQASSAQVETCSICLEPLSDPAVTTPCNHRFDYSCIEMCIREAPSHRSRCPLCRREMTHIRPRRLQAASGLPSSHAIDISSIKPRVRSPIEEHPELYHHAAMDDDDDDDDEDELDPPVDLAQIHDHRAHPRYQSAAAHPPWTFLHTFSVSYAIALAGEQGEGTTVRRPRAPQAQSASHGVTGPVTVRFRQAPGGPLSSAGPRSSGLGVREVASVDACASVR